jgi:FMN-dependent NADH-azoreductase
VTTSSGWTGALSRRSILQGALVGLAGATTVGCTSGTPSSSAAEESLAPSTGSSAPGVLLKEQDAAARPAVTNPLRSIQQYDTVLLASPIWGGRAPMLMTTFTEALTFTGTTVHPVTTHAMSGLGTTERDYAASCRGARLGEGPAVEAWLRRIGLPGG